MQDDKEKAAAVAEAATARLKTGLRAAKSLVRDYRAKFCSEEPSEPRSADRKRMFQFDR